MSVGFVHAFAVTATNKVFSWVPQPSVPPTAEHPNLPLQVIGINAGTQIIDIRSGNFQTILLTSDHLVLKIDHPALSYGPEVFPEQQMPFKALHIKRLVNIQLISACCGHLLALERDD